MWDGPKFVDAPYLACVLHIKALCYSANALTDGFVPASKARELVKRATRRDFDNAIQHLTTVQPGCKHPAWERRALDFHLHDYDDPLYGNPLKADLDSRREQKRAAGMQGGKKSASVRQEKYGTARPLSSPPEAGAEAPSASTPEAPASGSASQFGTSNHKLSPEADAKLARAGAQAQPFPSLPLPTQEEHGDVAGVGGNGASASPSPQVQVLRLLDWLLAKRGWSSWSTQESQQHEARMALNIVELGIPRERLFPMLEVWWFESDPDDRPSSLEYFWTRLQDEQHAALKQGRPHVHVDNGPTKIEPKVKRRG